MLRQDKEPEDMNIGDQQGEILTLKKDLFKQARMGEAVVAGYRSRIWGDSYGR